MYVAGESNDEQVFGVCHCVKRLRLHFAFLYCVVTSSCWVGPDAFNPNNWTVFGSGDYVGGVPFGGMAAFQQAAQFKVWAHSVICGPVVGPGVYNV